MLLKLSKAPMGSHSLAAHQLTSPTALARRRLATVIQPEHLEPVRRPRCRTVGGLDVYTGL